MTVISEGSRRRSSRSTPRIEHRDLERVVDRPRAEPEALPGLVELDRERPVHVEVARLDRQVVRLERAAALLVDDVEGADDPDVVDEVREVAGAPAAVEIADEGRAADRAEDQVRPAEGDVRSGLRAWSSNVAGAVAIRASTWAGSSRTRRVDRSTDAPAPANASRTRSPRTSTPISARIRSDARWIASRWSADRISSGRNGLTRRRHGSWASPGAARRGRRRGPSCGSAASGVVPSGVVRGSSTTGCYGPPIRRRRRVLRGAAATRGSGSPRPAPFLMRVSDVTRSMTVGVPGSSRQLRPSVGHGRRHEARRSWPSSHWPSSASVPSSSRPAACRRTSASTTQYLTGAATTGDVTDDVAATGTVAPSASYGLTFGAPAHLAGGHDERRIDDLDGHGRQGQGRRHGQGRPGPRDRRHRRPQAPAGRREHRGRHSPDRPAGRQGEPVRRERRGRRPLRSARPRSASTTPRPSCRPRSRRGPTSRPRSSSRR